MKRNKLVEYHAKFQIGGLLKLGLGGPYSFVSHSIKPGEDYFEILAKEMEFIAVRPFESLNLEEKSDWSLSETVKDRFTEQLEPVYMKWSCFVPEFSGDGTLFTLIGSQEFGKVCMTQRVDAHFTGIKSGMSVTDLLKVIRDLYTGTHLGEWGTYWMDIPVRDWRLKFVLKRTWKARNPKKSSYEIFVPTPEWVREHAAFATEHASTNV